MKKLLLAMPLTATALWLAWQFGASLNSSHASLTIAAEKLLAGGTMTGDFNEPNPPMSFLMYVIPVLMTKYLCIPSWYAPYAFGLLCLTASALAVREVLKYWPRPDDDGKTALLCAYIFANTLLTGSVYFYFGERDQIVVLGLYPFLLVQLGMTWRYEMPKSLTRAVLAAGAFAIMIKPQFGLLPVLALAHRMVAQKRFLSIARDADFIALAGATIACGAVIALLFPDYVAAGNFRDFMLFYVTAKNPRAPFLWLLYMAMLISALAFGKIWGLKPEQARPALLCHFGAFVSLLLFLLQMKGFYYHLIPFFVFFLTGIGLQAHEIGRKYLGARWFAAPAVVTAVFCIALILKFDRVTALRHADFAHTPLARLVADCAPGCGYIVFGENLENISQVHTYTGAAYGSRFPNLWWLTGVVTGLDQNPRDPALNRLKATYVHYVALDVQRHRPAVLAFISNLTVGGHRNFDLTEFFSGDALFRQELRHYRKMAPLQDNRNNYFLDRDPGNDVPLTYDVYRRTGK